MLLTPGYSNWSLTPFVCCEQLNCTRDNQLSNTRKLSQIPYGQCQYISSVQSLSCVLLFATPWTAACQASLSITNPWSLLKVMSIKLVMPSNHLILCHPLLLPSIFPSISIYKCLSIYLFIHIKYIYKYISEHQHQHIYMCQCIISLKNKNWYRTN